MRKLFYVNAAMLSLILCQSISAQKQTKPNVIIIYTDDLGYGDLSCYGATKVRTPNIDRIAKEGIMFTNAHATSSTCTPSRYAMITGEYPWRKKGTGIAAGDAGSIIDESQFTLAKLIAMGFCRFLCW